MSRAATREGIPHIAVVLTDGMSQNMEATLEEAPLVHEAGITVFVIGKQLPWEPKHVSQLLYKIFPAYYIYITKSLFILAPISKNRNQRNINDIVV